MDLGDRAPGGLPQRHRAVAVLDPVLVEDLEALLLPGAGDAEDRDRLAGVPVELQAGLDHAARDDVHARVRDDRHHHGDLLHAVFLEDLLGQAAGLGDGRVAADLGVVGGPAALLAHGVGERERAAARADHEADVAVEAGVLALDDATMVGGVDRLDGLLERGRGVALAGALLRADAQRLDQALLARHALVLHLHVRVERDERAVLQLRQRVDLGERHVVVEEQPGQAREHRGGALQGLAGDAGGGDDLLGLEVGEGLERGEVAAADVVGVLLGDLLDVDAAHVAEQHQRLLRGSVPDDARVVLLLDLGLRVDEHAARHVPADLQLEDVLGVGLGFRGRVGELDAAGLHAPAGEHLGLDHGRTVDPPRDLGRLRGVGREAVVGDGDAGALDDLARLELEEPHGRTSCGAEAYTAAGSGASP